MSARTKERKRESAERAHTNCNRLDNRLKARECESEETGELQWGVCEPDAGWREREREKREPVL